MVILSHKINRCCIINHPSSDNTAEGRATSSWHLAHLSFSSERGEREGTGWDLPRMPVWKTPDPLYWKDAAIGSFKITLNKSWGGLSKRQRIFVNLCYLAMWRDPFLLCLTCLLFPPSGIY